MIYKAFNFENEMVHMYLNIGYFIKVNSFLLVIVAYQNREVQYVRNLAQKDYESKSMLGFFEGIFIQIVEINGKQMVDYASPKFIETFGIFIQHDLDAESVRDRVVKKTCFQSFVEFCFGEKAEDLTERRALNFSKFADKMILLDMRTDNDMSRNVTGTKKSSSKKE